VPSDSVLDAYFTIFLVERGAEEINPFMNFLIGRGYMWFFFMKYIPRELAVLVFSVCKNHSLMRVGIAFALFVYFVILTNHLFAVFPLSVL
jgi:hypothetical protein